MATKIKLDRTNLTAFQERLILEFEKHGNTKKVAKALGISQPRLSQLIRLAGLKLVRRVDYVYTPTERANMRDMRAKAVETA